MRAASKPKAKNKKVESTLDGRLSLANFFDLLAKFDAEDKRKEKFK